MHLMTDKMTKWNELKNAKTTFNTQNTYLNSQRLDRVQQETDERVNADISYFPFTHGEVIEK
jgi:hypothetical protein